MKIEGILKCRCGAQMVFYRDVDGVLQFMEVTEDENGVYQPIKGD